MIILQFANQKLVSTNNGKTIHTHEIKLQDAKKKLADPMKLNPLLPTKFQPHIIS